MQFLVETCLLTHGLKSVTDELLFEEWPKDIECIAWVDKGKARIGGVEEYMPFRSRKDIIRIDRDKLPMALSEGISGPLTASGTMALAERMGISLAVSCGIGGLCDIKGEELCPDLPAVAEMKVSLLATAFKDMLDISGSIGWLRSHGAKVLGVGSSRCTGYLFNSADVELDGMLEENSLPGNGGLLILNPIAAEYRIQDISLLQRGIAAGKAAEAAGGYFHPAANAEFDRLTDGEISRIQLRSIIANAKLADRLAIK